MSNPTAPARPTVAPPPTAPWQPTVYGTASVEVGTSPRRRLFLLQGPAGTGKTHCAATFPDPFFMLFDKGSATHDRLGVPYAMIQDWDEVDRHWLRALHERRLSALVGRKVETLVIDSLTSQVDSTLIELGGGGTREVGQSGWDTYYSRVHSLLNAATIAARPDSRRPDAETYNLVALVHENVHTTGPEGEIKETVNAVQGKMNGRLAMFFDAHYLTHVETTSQGNTYWLLTRPQRFQAKGRGKLVINHTRHCKGDTIVGANNMPPRVANTYQALTEAWDRARAANNTQGGNPNA